VYVVWHDWRNNLKQDIYFNYSIDGGSTWQATDTRLDTGDPPGANHSRYPQISSSGSNVYVVWEDERNADLWSDIYFNYSIDGGSTWQATDTRLDTEDPPGTNQSINPQISSTGSNVYVVWDDRRNGEEDPYFNYSTDNGVTWQVTDIRLDTGDTPGASLSWRSQVSCSGSNVYVVWQDYRNSASWVKADIYFNYSADGGATWQPADVRLDTGDPPGANNSKSPQISSSGSNVYVVWSDGRNVWGPDIYFNSSTDGGATWQPSDIRLDTGDAPGASGSWSPQINSSVENVYVVWEDGRNGTWEDIYFNAYTAVDPVPDIKANGSDGPITIIRSDLLTMTVEFDAGGYSGVDADWWLVVQTPFGWYYYDKTSGWLPGREVTLQIPLRDLPLREVLNMSGLPAGNYTFHFGVDLVMNGKFNMGQAYYDSVEVTINP
jgi:hypothetical protein